MNRARFLALTLVMAVAGCGPELPDETQIRGRIGLMQEALDEGDIRKFMSPIAEDFSADGRDIDQRGVRVMLNRELRAYEKLKARIFDIEIELHGEDRATASMHAVTTGGSGLIPETGRWYRIDSGWRREGGDWMLISARWESVAARN